MRTHAGLDAQELQSLWSTDRDAALVEWTYRMLETPAAMDDAAGFSQWMVSQWYGPALFRSAAALATESPLVAGRRLQFKEFSVRSGDQVAGAFPARALHLYQQGLLSLNDFLGQLREFLTKPRS